MNELFDDYRSALRTVRPPVPPDENPQPVPPLYFYRLTVQNVSPGFSSTQFEEHFKKKLNYKSITKIQLHGQPAMANGAAPNSRIGYVIFT